MKKKLIDFTSFSLADWLPIIRLVSIPFVIMLAFLNRRYLAALVFLLSFCTDALDGFIGRTFNMTSPRLSKLDSAADMTLLASGLLVYCYFEWNFVKSHVLILGLTFGLYIFQALFAFYRYHKTTSFHTLAARLTAVVQVIFITYSLYYGTQEAFFYFTLIVSLYEVSEEIILIALHPEYPGQIPSLIALVARRRRKK